MTGERSLRPGRPLDLHRTLFPTRPLAATAGEVWRVTRTPDGPATVRLRMEGDILRAQAWGPGSGWALERVPTLVGEGDDPAGFEPIHPLLRELHRRHPGIRIPRTEAVFEAAVPTILEQKVVGKDARRAYLLLVRQLGEPAPGPVRAWVPPPPAVIAATPYWRFHPWGVEQRRATTIINAALHASRLEETVGMDPAAAQRRLTLLPGLGAWSAAEIATVALGDADAVSVGDYHLPNLVSWALAGEERGSDDRMLELLEPYRGHRARVLRLLQAAPISAPRRGPRMPLSDIARR